MEAEDTILSLNQHPSAHAGQPQEVPTHNTESKNDDYGAKGKKTLPRLPQGGSFAARANAIAGLHFEQWRDGQGFWDFESAADRESMIEDGDGDRSGGGGGGKGGSAVESDSGTGEEGKMLLGKSG